MKATKKILKSIKKCGGVIIDSGDDGFACQLPRIGITVQYSLCIIASWGEGWDHVSIHAKANNGEFVPFWEDMCFVKNIFFTGTETVIQYHPAKKNYVNQHQHTLHLWRPQNKEIQLPPTNLV